MKQAVVNQLYAAILVGLLAGGLAYPPLQGIAAVLAWFAICAGAAYVVVGFVVAYLADNSESTADRKKCREIVREIVEKADKRSKFLRRFGVVKVLTIALLLAVSGMTFAAFSYSVVCLLMQLVIKLHRAVLETDLN